MRCTLLSMVLYSALYMTPPGLFIDLNENLHIYNTNDIHFFKDGPSEKKKRCIWAMATFDYN